MSVGSLDLHIKPHALTDTCLGPQTLSSVQIEELNQTLDERKQERAQKVCDQDLLLFGARQTT